MNSLQNRIASLLQRTSDFFERNAWAALLLITLLYLPAVFAASRAKPLWHDELYTFNIAAATTLHDLWSQSRIFDLNPPLIYLVTRASFHVLGVDTFAARLPLMLCFLAALYFFFAFVRRRMGVLFATFAVAAILLTDTFDLAVEARPYALMFIFFTLALWSWQSAAEPPPVTPTVNPPIPRSFALLLLTLAGFGLLLSHIFSIAAIGCLLFAEFIRTLRRRKFDWLMALALLLPFVTVVLYGPMFQNHGSAMYPKAFQPSPADMAAFYILTTWRDLAGTLATLLVALLLLGRRRPEPEPAASTNAWSFTTPEWAAIASVFVLPLVLMLYLMHKQSAFFPRYGAIEAFAVALIAAALLGRWTTAPGKSLDPRAALLGSLILFAASGLWKAIPHEIATGTLIPTVANSEPKLLPCQACQISASLDPTLPLVVASGITFVEMNHREPPSTLDHLYYLTDPVASAQYAHANIFERMPLILATFHLGGRSEPYPRFVTEHPHFFVYGRMNFPEDWLLRKLAADHASLKSLGPIKADYRDTELYEVRMPTSPAVPSSAIPTPAQSRVH